MRHLVSGKRLSRTASHRKAMLSNLATSILDKERVVTTIVKAKEVRGVVERMISYAKQGDLHSIRMAQRTVRDKSVLNKLFTDIGPSYKQREGGYTRIVKLDERKGDNALMSIIELVGRAPAIQAAAPAARQEESKTLEPKAGDVSAQPAEETKTKRKSRKTSSTEQPEAQEEKE